MPTKKASTSSKSSSAKTTAAKKPAAKKAASTTKKSTVTTTASKTTNKSTAKKTAPQKATKAATGEARALVCAKGSDCFWVHDGPILKDLVELAEALADMPEQMFAHHVGGARHDFAQWVEHVLKDAETAAALRKAKKPATAHKVVVRQLNLYNLDR